MSQEQLDEIRERYDWARKLSGQYLTIEPIQKSLDDIPRLLAALEADGWATK